MLPQELGPDHSLPSIAPEERHILPGRTRASSFGSMLFMAILMLIVIFLVVLIFKIAWNGTMPQIFGVGSIDLLQALLLIIVARVLFSSGGTVVYVAK